MPSLGGQGRIILLGLLSVAASACCGVFAGEQQASAQTDSDPPLINSSAVNSPSANSTASSGDDQAQFKLHVESNLVVVRAVVRDSQGQAVKNLRKEDFRLLDNGKEQVIQQFDTEVRTSASSNHRSTPAKSETAAPEHFVALYFDDLNLPFDDIVRVRDAADHYLATTLQPSDRAAIFSSSGSIAVDFTSDLKQLHDALFKLRPSSRTGGTDCPNITDYQADQIVNHEDPDSYAVAIDEAKNQCHMLLDSKSAQVIINDLARRILNQSLWQAQYSLQSLNELVKHVSDMPGQRNIVLLSPGFLSGEELQFQVDAMINRALRSQVVISSIDSSGLAVMLRESDIHTAYTSIDPHLQYVRRDLALTRERMATWVLAQVAEDTGGEFFHNDNDLNVGMRQATTLSGVDYILAFVPKNLKLDGRFHTLKVTLGEKRPGVTLQARRGYFAPKAGVPKEDEIQDEIRGVVLSRVEMQQLPVDISTELSKAAGKEEFSVMAHVDVRPVHFQKIADHNVNTLTFISTIFDGDGKWVTGQQQQVHLNLPDAALQEFLSSAGIVVRTTFRLAPGDYTVREVVVDSEDHHLGAVSRHAEIP
jgi:VWFA-related protein